MKTHVLPSAPILHEATTKPLPLRIARSTAERGCMHSTHLHKAPAQHNHDHHATQVGLGGEVPVAHGAEGHDDVVDAGVELQGRGPLTVPVLNDL